MQVVYVLASNRWDKYAQMVYLSASSLKRIHPEAHTILLTDHDTARLLQPIKAGLMSVLMN